jgi:hypothetical protein
LSIIFVNLAIHFFYLGHFIILVFFIALVTTLFVFSRNLFQDILLMLFGFTQVEAKRALQKIEQSFAETISLMVKHMLFALEECGLPRVNYACES